MNNIFKFFIIWSYYILADSLLNNKDNKGAIVKIKTGEGKSYIISILAIILAKFYEKNRCNNNLNYALERRDEEEQREFFNLFKVKSGIYYKNRDKDFFYEVV